MMASGWLGADWGNVPAWVGTVLTSSSLLIAASTYRKSVAEKKREFDEHQREQVSKVSVWTSDGGTVKVANGNDVAVTIGAHIDLGYQILEAKPSPFAPGVSYALIADPGALAEYCRANKLPEGHGVPTLTITDSYGRVWSRAPDGTVQPLDADSHAKLRERTARLGTEVRFEKVEES